MIFLDYERNIAGTYYIAGVSDGGDVSQIVLNEKLRGLAVHHSFKITTPVTFTCELLNEAVKKKDVIAAYSEAEKKYINEILSSNRSEFRDVKYLNMAKAAKKWANKYHHEEFNALPPLVVGANQYDQARHRNSLASISRLIANPAPNDYAIGHTTQRFNQVMSALELHNQNYAELTATQKGKATRALKHNNFDVSAMLKLYTRIKADNEKIIEKATSPLFEH